MLLSLPIVIIWRSIVLEKNKIGKTLNVSHRRSQRRRLQVFLGKLVRMTFSVAWQMFIVLPSILLVRCIANEKQNRNLHIRDWQTPSIISPIHIPFFNFFQNNV